MATATLRRLSDNVLMCSNILQDEWSGYNWSYTLPIHHTIAGNSIPQEISVMEKFFSAKLQFATDDPVNTMARYDSMEYLAKKLTNFKFTDHFGDEYECKIMVIEDHETTNVGDVDVKTVKVTFKQNGYIP